MNHVENLKRFDAIIPDGEGLVYCQLFSDETHVYVFEMYGEILAESTNHGAFLPTGENDETMREFGAFIEKLNDILTEINESK